MPFYEKWFISNVKLGTDVAFLALCMYLMVIIDNSSFFCLYIFVLEDLAVLPTVEKGAKFTSTFMFFSGMKGG